MLPLSFVACYGRPQLRFINYLYGVFTDSGFVMGDSSSDNVSFVSVVMFIIFSTEDGHLSSGLSEMFT